MKKIIKVLLSIIIISILILPMFSFAKVDLEQAYSDGARWGGETGRVYGYRDLVNEEESDWYTAYLSVFPTNKSLTDFFNLDEDEDDYNREFIRGYRNQFLEGYKAGYKNLVEDYDGDGISPSETAGIEHGKMFAELDAAQTALKDFTEGGYNEWSLNYPNDLALKVKYNLYKDDSIYIDAFLESYKENYELAYKEAFREANNESSLAPESNGYDQGYSLGTAKGETDGLLDLVNGEISNWQNAYNNLIEANTLAFRYNLYRDNKEYMESFKGGFKAAYEIAYQDMYQVVNYEIENKNVNYVKVDTTEKIVEYNSYSVDMVGGNKNVNTSTPLYLELSEGTVYSTNTYIGIKENQFPIRKLGEKIQGTSVYDIDVINDDFSIKFQKPVKLSFNFYGSSSAGIYKFVNQEWMYLPTKFAAGEIYTDIPAVDFKGGQYAVLIDNNYRPLNEALLHWAYSDIKVFIKRGSIDSSVNFNPDSFMTRKEFSLMIYKNTFGTNEKIFNPTVDFVDKELFGSYENAINYMVSKGYMNGIAIDVFDSDGYITYNQVEVVMNRILKNDFKWEDISNSMLTERFKVSKVNDYKSNYINKAEVVYMLNNVLGSKVLFDE
ncbi:MAG: hypothetical protein U9N10_00330 [Bacillota bacterium]|nr:hypothetical protein [Bacillota bacterium]